MEPLRERERHRGAKASRAAGSDRDSSWPGTGLLCTHTDLSVGLDPSMGLDPCVRAGGLLSTNNPLLLPLQVPSHHTHTKPLQGDEDPPRVLSQSPGGSGSVQFSPPVSHRHPPHSGDSSEPSPQSLSWSQTKCLGMHCRFPHMNSRSSQVLLYTATGHRHRQPPPAPRHPQPPALGHSQQPAARVSSAPSAQSLSPSQSQRSGTHT